jgi:hypothetical protein
MKTQPQLSYRLPSRGRTDLKFILMVSAGCAPTSGTSAAVLIELENGQIILAGGPGNVGGFALRNQLDWPGAFRVSGGKSIPAFRSVLSCFNSRPSGRGVIEASKAGGGRLRPFQRRMS